jgi:hypothetical protein
MRHGLAVRTPPRSTATRPTPGGSGPCGNSSRFYLLPEGGRQRPGRAGRGGVGGYMEFTWQLPVCPWRHGPARGRPGGGAAGRGQVVGFRPSGAAVFCAGGRATARRTGTARQPVSGTPTGRCRRITISAGTPGATAAVWVLTAVRGGKRHSWSRCTRPNALRH